MRRRATIITYHAVADCPPAEDPHNLFVSPSAFAEQMRYLARRRRVVTLEEAMSGAPGDGVVAITFDDAYMTVSENAVPILAELGLPATIFVPTTWIGKRAGWLTPSACDLRIMDEAALRHAMDLGMTIESHGAEHAHLTRVAAPEAMKDVTASADRIEEITGRRPRYLAYPYGEFSASVARAVREAGFAAAFSLDRPGPDPFAYERTQITPLDGRAMFALKTSGRFLGFRHAPAARAVYSVVGPVIRRARRR